jgi:O-antigen/teichoic acid export membrane protein
MGTGTAAAQAFTAVGFWLGARHSRPEDFGNVSAAIAIALIGTDCLDLGTNSLLVRNLARSIDVSEQRRILGGFVGLKSVIAAIGLIVWAAGATLYSLAFGRDPVTIALGVYMTATVLSMTLSAALRGVGLIARCSFVAAIERAIMAGTIAVLVLSGRSGTFAMAVGLCVGSIASATVSLLLLPRDARSIRRPRLAEGRRLLAEAAPFGVVGLVTDLQRLDVAVARLGGGGIAAGLYAAASRMIQPYYALTNAGSLVLFPRLASLDEDRRRIAIRKVVRAATLLSCAAVLPLVLFAPQVMRLVLGQPYASAATPFRILLVAVVLVALNQPLAAFFQAGDRAAEVAWAVSIASVVGLAIGYAASSTLKAVGAAVAAVSLQAILLSLLLRLYRRMTASSSSPTSGAEEL